MKLNEESIYVMSDEYKKEVEGDVKMEKWYFPASPLRFCGPVFFANDIAGNSVDCLKDDPTVITKCTHIVGMKYGVI